MSGGDCTSLLRLPDNELLAGAKKLRQQAHGDQIEMCAIISIRCGACDMDCKFCGQSRYNAASSPNFEMLPAEEICRRIRQLAERPVAHIGLVASGGALSSRNVDVICNVLENLDADLRGRICLSGGRLGGKHLADLHAAGLRRCHHNLEACSRFYPQICKSQTWQARAATVERVMLAGMDVCCGGLFGLGESWEDRLQFARELTELGVTNIPMNFLQPIPGTPLAQRPLLQAVEALRIIALFRHVLPAATLRVCGGRLPVFGKGQAAVFAAGANALMTGDFMTTRGEGIEGDCRMLAELGLRNTISGQRA